MSAFAVLAQQPVIPDFGTGSKCETENHTFCAGWVADHWSDTLQPALHATASPNVRSPLQIEGKAIHRLTFKT